MARSRRLLLIRLQRPRPSFVSRLPDGKLAFGSLPTASPAPLPTSGGTEQPRRVMALGVQGMWMNVCLTVMMASHGDSLSTGAIALLNDCRTEAGLEKSRYTSGSAHQQNLAPTWIRVDTQKMHHRSHVRVCECLGTEARCVHKYLVHAVRTFVRGIHRTTCSRCVPCGSCGPRRQCGHRSPWGDGIARGRGVAAVHAAGQGIGAGNAVAAANAVAAGHGSRRMRWRWHQPCGRRMRCSRRRQCGRRRPLGSPQAMRSPHATGIATGDPIAAGHGSPRMRWRRHKP